MSNHPSSSPRPAASEPASATPAISRGGRDVAVPPSCTPEVNQKLARLLAKQTRENVDNVMVC
ncbi:MAG TPA: hypothetical protein VH139_06365 [Acidobacteriaceae bacterium]|nr:hypothetical protein [Acidobacteriaceae bacterium]